MAEGGLIKGLAGEAEDSLQPADAPVAGGEGIAIAAALDAARADPELSADLRRFLDIQAGVGEAQRKLVSIQTEHLHEQREVLISHMRLRRLAERLRIGSQVFFIVAATVVGLILLVLLRDAFTSREVVVEAFEAPPALAARGLSGKVVAEGLLDKLTDLQAATRGTAQKRDISSAWTNDIKVEAPGTGVSIGEIVRLLKAQFGHDVHIEGDLVQNPDGALALTVRGGGGLPKTFTGTDLGGLDGQAAEYLYGQFEPGLYAEYLFQSLRYADAIAFIKASLPGAKPSERPSLLNVWANALENTGGSTQQALDLYERAIAIKPDFWVGYNNVMNARWMLGDEEGVWRTGTMMAKAAGGRPGRAPELYYQNLDYLSWNLMTERKSLIDDLDSSLGVGTGVAVDAPTLADVEIRLHDPASAELQLQTTPTNTNDPAVPAMTHFVRGEMATAAGDKARAASEMEAFAAAYADPAISANYPGYVCLLAPAEEAAGHPDKADAALATGGHYIDCYRFRGDILDGRGDWAGARKAYAAAIAIAPDLPAAYYSFGLALARHGDLEGAKRQFALAHARGPHWADPLEAWANTRGREGR